MHCEAVGKRYGRGHWILRDVDLSLAPGDVLAVVGANGSGKSTLLRVLAGLTRPTTGRVTGPATARRAVVGYVPDRFTAPERLTATAYLTHLGRIRGLTTAAARARAGRLLDRLALAGGADAALRTLSKGNARKVALAQALLVPPDLLVLDEPWSGLDAAAHGVLADLIGETAAGGGTVVFTDHREAVAAARATTVGAVAGGRVVLRSGGGPSTSEATGPAAPAQIVLTAPGAAPEPAASPPAWPEPAVSPPAWPEPAASPPAGPDWAALPGVLALERRGPEIHLRVDPTRTDAVLLTALRHHWSVHAVSRPRPHPQPPHPRPEPAPRTTVR
ncbi:ATP-binding cassette domain-containing protein [Kitasatospora sp. NPDC056327]|uniref:ATP-binding cassette domain-containing protein n=1 Tax=Kitasatospora sp. NPDC056327 TaxID=3345785 RepID=UPI0035DD3B66